jgi:hypothetical protein|nr:MAG TPA: hypothetical protein [Caudoviricetes sp.]
MKRHYVLMQAPAELKEVSIKPIILIETSDVAGKQSVERFIDLGYIVAGNLASDLTSKLLMQGLTAKVQQRVLDKTRMLNRIQHILNGK